MEDRPMPPDPFARKGVTQPEVAPSLSDALSGFAPKPIEDRMTPVMPVANIAPDTGRGGGRPRRRGDAETRSKTINFRMKPREQAELNALCDELNRSIPDTIMIMIEHFRKTA